MALQGVGEIVAGELAALVGIEDLRPAVLGERFLECLDTELRAERVRQPPRQHGTAHPVHDHHQVEKAPGHRDVGDVRAPDLIDPLDRKPTQQVGVDLVVHRRRARVRSLVDRHQTGEPHQTPDPFAVDDMALGRQPRRHPPRAVIRSRQVLPINQRHDRAVFLADLRRPAVDRSAGDRQQSALSRYRQRWSLALDQTAPFRPAHLPSFRDKKIVFDLQLANLPIQNINLLRCCAAAFENARRSVQQLLLPGVELVRVNPVRARQLGKGPVAPCLRRGKLLIAASATLALNAAPCFLRVCFMSCSRAIGAS